MDYRKPSSDQPDTDLSRRRPAWLKTRLPTGETSRDVDALLGRLKLHTVCTSARCPNRGECWGRGTATFMILGDVCTRHCRFCAVRTGNPGGVLDPTEPERIAQAVRELKLKYVVITSVDRDDLVDLGAGAFAAVIRALKQGQPPIRADTRRHTPTEGLELGSEPNLRPSASIGGFIRLDQDSKARIEVLTPDFAARRELLAPVLAESPDVFAHNVETVAARSTAVRDRRAGYELSLRTLKQAKEYSPGQVTKSGFMLGLGETFEQVVQTLRDLRSNGVDIVTIGQYLRPARNCLPVVEYVSPERFEEYGAVARELGFRAVRSAPLVRSSYLAEAAAADAVAPRS